jgi:hypothetical protein
VENRTEQNRQQIAPTASAILSDGTIVEMIFQPKERRTFFAIYNAGRWTLQDGIDLGSDARLAPFSPSNSLINNEVVLLGQKMSTSCPNLNSENSKANNRNQ